jgi:hypothetical protein
MIDSNQPQFILPEQQTHQQQLEEVIFLVEFSFFFQSINKIIFSILQLLEE